MTHDPIADLLTRIRNGYLARLHEVAVPYSKLKAEILRILKKNGYIVDFVESEDKSHEMELVFLSSQLRRESSQDTKLTHLALVVNFSVKSTKK
jgi:ribosomal protein S8